MLVTCPMHDGSCGEAVEAIGLDVFEATTVEVAPCSALTAQGWTGPQLVERKTRADRFVPAPAPAVRHAEGLVTFG